MLDVATITDSGTGINTVLVNYNKQKVVSDYFYSNKDEINIPKDDPDEDRTAAEYEIATFCVDEGIVEIWVTANIPALTDVSFIKSMQLKVDGALKASDSNNVPSIGPPGTTTDLDQSFLIHYATIVATGGSTFDLSLVYD